MAGRERQRGPRGAGADTKGDILEAALALFVRDGFDRTSLRAIAREAQVDPALVRHYFSSKQEVFVAAMRPVPPQDPLIASLTAGPPESAGERVVSAFALLWDDPENGPRLQAILTAAVTSPEVADEIRALLLGEILGPLVASLGHRDEPMRIAACASQLMGVAVARYLVGIEPLASADRETLVALIAPTLQRYLDGPMPKQSA